jgi:hypothetical protein
MYDQYPALFDKPPACHDFALRTCENSKEECFYLHETLVGKDRGFSIAKSKQVSLNI